MDEKNSRRNCETCGAYNAVLDRCEKHKNIAGSGQYCEDWEEDSE